MDRQAEVRALHEQLSAAWSLYARCTGVGEVVDLEGLRLANGRQPWFLLRLLLDSRVVDLPMSYNPIAVILSSLKPFFFNGLQ